jgi:hypothetical protein
MEPDMKPFKPSVPTPYMEGGKTPTILKMTTNMMQSQSRNSTNGPVLESCIKKNNSDDYSNDDSNDDKPERLTFMMQHQFRK